ncbi:MAG: tyrosine-type recombinase/integrase [Chloroflexi bacterium]|nr:tyrosine-type recombinase/integrase [Chloroflexota bacterium]
MQQVAYRVAPQRGEGGAITVGQDSFTSAPTVKGVAVMPYGDAPSKERRRSRDYKLAFCRAGLDESYRFHDLRHAATTMMLAAGVHPKMAAERLGHSDVRMTLSHVLSGLDDAERLERAVRGEPQHDDRLPDAQ